MKIALEAKIEIVWSVVSWRIFKTRALGDRGGDALGHGLPDVDATPCMSPGRRGSEGAGTRTRRPAIRERLFSHRAVGLTD